MKIDHIGISVADVERSIAFYREMFGMEPLCPISPFGGGDFERVMGVPGAQGRMCVIRGNDVQLELFEFANPAPPAQDPNASVSDRGISHFGITVRDIDATYERMLAAGVRFHCPVTTFPSGIKAAYGRDPDGNVFELLEMGPPPTG
ncbi:MAG: VOC family protein [Novosphingobium sp.]|nr:VOC family protein [Novosphingobium sp.]